MDWEYHNGGTTGQVLKKKSDSDNDTEWANEKTYTNATSENDGLMSSSDKSKLDGIEENANNYVHPTTPGNRHIPTGGKYGQILVYNVNGAARWEDNQINFIVAGLTENEHYNTTRTSTNIIPLKRIIASEGTGLTLESDGGIKIGDNINYIRCSASIYIRSGQTAGDDIKAYFYKNGTVVANTAQTAVAAAHSITIPTKIIPVTKGDKIYLEVANIKRTNQQIGAFATLTYFNVEAVK